jgi:hypothetical protein
MTLVFGAVLPTIIGTIVVMLAATVQRAMYPSLVRLWMWLKRRLAPSS